MNAVILLIIGAIGGTAILYSIYLEQKKAEERYVFPDHDTRVSPIDISED